MIENITKVIDFLEPIATGVKQQILLISTIVTIVCSILLAEDVSFKFFTIFTFIIIPWMSLHLEPDKNDPFLNIYKQIFKTIKIYPEYLAESYGEEYWQLFPHAENWEEFKIIIKKNRKDQGGFHILPFRKCWGDFDIPLKIRRKKISIVNSEAPITTIGPLPPPPLLVTKSESPITIIGPMNQPQVTKVTPLMPTVINAKTLRIISWEAPVRITTREAPVRITTENRQSESPLSVHPSNYHLSQ